MGRVAHLITRKWVAGLLALFAILGAGAVIGVVGQAEQPPTATAALPTGSDSRAAAELRAELPEAEGSAAVVLFSSDDVLTADEVRTTVTSFVADVLGKNPIQAEDRPGFIVNALLIPYLCSAIRMLESGFATAEDIDRGLVLGAAHPQGPLALADLIGLDTTKAVAESLYEEFRDPSSVAPALLNRMVEAGLLGRKTGRGFYDYSAKKN